MSSRYELIAETLRALAGGFLGEDRKEDRDLPSGAIEEAVMNWEVTIGEMALLFEEELRRRIPVPANGEHVGQAAHNAHSEKLQAEVAKLEE